MGIVDVFSEFMGPIWEKYHKLIFLFGYLSFYISALCFFYHLSKRKKQNSARNIVSGE